jgi:hypothetical protein
MRMPGIVLQFGKCDSVVVSFGALMPTQPRIAFSSFPSASDPQFAVWQRVNARILGSSSPAGRPSNSAVLTEPLARTAPRGIWQLLAANNRELGRSAQAYPTFRAALDHVEEIREVASMLALRVDRHAHLETWYWVADLSDESVITSSRFFSSAAEAAKTATGAVFALAHATFDQAPRSRPRRHSAGESTRESSDSAPW